MSETLRPSTLGEILDRTAQLYRRNFWRFAGVAAIPIGAIMAIGAIGGALFAAAAATVRSANLPDAASIGFLALFAIVALPLYIAAAVFSYAGLTQAAVSAHRGNKVTIREVLKGVRPWFWRYLWFIMLQGIIVALIPGVIAGGAVGSLLYLEHITGGNLATSAVVGFLIFLAIAGAGAVIIWLALGYSMGLAVCVVEKKPAWESLQRSWKLSQGTRGRIFVMYLLVIALVFAVSMVAAIPFLIIVTVISSQGGGAANASTAVVVAEITRVVVDFILQVLLAPISWIALVLFYYDQRIRKEGFDIEWMMEQAGLAVHQGKSGAGLDGGLTPVAPGVLQVEGAGDSRSGGISAAVLPPDTVEER